MTEMKKTIEEIKFLTAETLKPICFKLDTTKSILLIKSFHKRLNRYKDFRVQPPLIINYNWHIVK